MTVGNGKRSGTTSSARLSGSGFFFAICASRRQSPTVKSLTIPAISCACSERPRLLSKPYASSSLATALAWLSTHGTRAFINRDDCHDLVAKIPDLARLGRPLNLFFVIDDNDLGYLVGILLGRVAD